MIKYNHHCDYTWFTDQVINNNRNDDCGKSLEKPAAKLVAAK